MLALAGNKNDAAAAPVPAIQAAAASDAGQGAVCCPDGARKAAAGVAVY